MDKNDVLQVGIDTTSGEIDKNKWTSDILFLNNLRDLPLADGSTRLDRLVAVVCYTGRLQIDLNAVPYELHSGEVLIMHQNDVACNTMLSPDFEGSVLCLVRKMVLELFGESNMWDYIFHLAENPVITVSAESLRMLRAYGEVLQMKLQARQSAFRGEIVRALVKTMFYEVRENIDSRSYRDVRGLRHGEVLFKQFMEVLADNAVKPRNVSWYAEHLCITPKHLSTVCRQVSGKTAFEWINEYVLIDIRNLLKNSDKSIKEIVDVLNFPNASFFGSYCRKHFGMSPTEYRRHLRNSLSPQAPSPVGRGSTDTLSNHYENI